MSTIDAWRKVFSLSSATWTKIPLDVRQALGLRSDLGIIGQVICTRPGARGIAATVSKLNSILENE